MTYMYCSSCGAALSQQTKYCNRCGARLITTEETDVSKQLVKRLDEYMDGLFWTTVFGLGLILGGLALMDKALNSGQGLIIAYMILSSTAFLIVFGLHLWQIILMSRGDKKARNTVRTGPLDTNELGPEKPRISLEPSPSVTENTTRSLEASKERVTQ